MKGKRKWKKSIFSTFRKSRDNDMHNTNSGRNKRSGKPQSSGKKIIPCSWKIIKKELDIDRNEISYNSETDWDWSYYGGNHISKNCKEGDNGYYIRLGEYIYFCSF